MEIKTVWKAQLYNIFVLTLFSCCLNFVYTTFEMKLLAAIRINYITFFIINRLSIFIQKSIYLIPNLPKHRRWSRKKIFLFLVPHLIHYQINKIIDKCFYTPWPISPFDIDTVLDQQLLLRFHQQITSVIIPETEHKTFSFIKFPITSKHLRNSNKCLVMV